MRCRNFAVIDTGGYVIETEDMLAKAMLENIQMAIDESDIVIFLCDVIDGPTADERNIAAQIRKKGKPTIVAANKLDNPEREELVYSFYELGFETVLGVSATHGIGTGDLLDEVVSLLPPESSAEFRDADKNAIPIAIIGRPNVGKSTLLNSLLGKQRAIVDSTPGTTRDPIDILKTIDGKKYVFVDTAGIRRKGKIERGAEWVSVLHAHRALERSQVALLVLDASEGPVEGDAHVFGLAQDAGKACVILANKWDTVEKDTDTSGEMAKKIRETMKFLPYARIITISAKTHQRVSKVYALIDEAYSNYRKQVPANELEELLEDMMQKNPPPVHSRRPVLLQKLSQARAAPPTFIVKTNFPEAIHFSYERYVVNRIYERFDFAGSPIIVKFRKSGKKKR